MKQTIFSNGRLNQTWHRCTRPMAVALGVVMMLFVFGMQSADAQTMMELGEARSNELVEQFVGEVNFLEEEHKIPQSGVKVDFNDRLALYYVNVKNQFKKDADIKETLISNVRSLAAAALAGDSPEVAPHLAGTTKNVSRDDFTGFETLVEGWDPANEDLTVVFTYWRNIKNR